MRITKCDMCGVEISGGHLISNADMSEKVRVTIETPPPHQGTNDLDLCSNCQKKVIDFIFNKPFDPIYNPSN